MEQDRPDGAHVDQERAHLHASQRERPRRRPSRRALIYAVENKKLGDVPFIETVGYHYCKLLSPGRAMEWIYIDGLYPPNL